MDHLHCTSWVKTIVFSWRTGKVIKGLEKDAMMGRAGRGMVQGMFLLLKGVKLQLGFAYFFTGKTRFGSLGRGIAN
jgi:hypothetical protein